MRNIDDSDVSDEEMEKSLKEIENRILIYNQNREKTKESNIERYGLSPEEEKEKARKKAHGYYLRIKEIKRPVRSLYNFKNRIRLNEQVKQRGNELRMKVLKHYSNSEEPSCACCGEKTYEFLAIDHMNNDGAQHRKKIGTHIHLYRWLINNNLPEGYQILCHNCNFSKGQHGICPHERKKGIEPSFKRRGGRPRKWFFDKKSQSMQLSMPK
jgi:hypothetical protein